MSARTQSLRTTAVTTAAASILALAASTAAAAGTGDDAEISVDHDCASVDVTSSKSISNVVLEFQDGDRQRFEDLPESTTGTFAGTGDDADELITTVWVKSGDNDSGDGPGYGERFDEFDLDACDEDAGDQGDDQPDAQPNEPGNDSTTGDDGDEPTDGDTDDSGTDDANDADDDTDGDDDQDAASDDGDDTAGNADATGDTAQPDDDTAADGDVADDDGAAANDGDTSDDADEAPDAAVGGTAEEADADDDDEDTRVLGVVLERGDATTGDAASATAEQLPNTGAEGVLPILLSALAALAAGTGLVRRRRGILAQ